MVEKGLPMVGSDWALKKYGTYHGGVKASCLIWENGEKPPMGVEAEKERPTLEVMGDVEVVGVTKDYEERREGEFWWALIQVDHCNYL